MARIRTVKPELWTSPQLARCSLLARLLFIGMFNHVDDHGREQAIVRQLAAAVFPLDDDLTLAEVSRAFRELVEQSLVTLYTVSDRVYFQVTGWDRHQKIDRPSKPRCPGPDDPGSAVIDGLEGWSREPRETLASVARDPIDRNVGTWERRNVGTSDQLLGAEAPPTVTDVDGFDVPMPVKVHDGSTITDALVGWCDEVGLETPKHVPPQELTGRLLDVVEDTLGTGKHSHGLRVGLVGDLIREVTGNDVPSEAWGHLRRLVSTVGARRLLEAVTTALTGGAGLSGGYADDPLAITKYAVGVLNGEGRRHG